MSKKSKDLSPPFKAEELKEAKEWFAAHRDEIPDAVAKAIGFGIDLLDNFSKNQAKARSLLTQLKRAFGIIPSSEKQKSGDPLSGLPPAETKPLTKKERLILQRDRLKRLSSWYRDLTRRHNAKAKKLDKKIMRLEDIELTEKDKAEIEQEQIEYDKRLDLGQRCDLDAAKSTEDLMRGAEAKVSEDFVEINVDRDGLPSKSKIKQQFYEERERLDFSFSVTKLDIAVEKIAIETKDGGQSLISASLEEIGPPKMKVTWGFLANMALLACQYAFPLNRFAALASTEAKRFSGGEMSRYFRYIASRFIPIYIELGLALRNVEIILGDDTPSRVLEIYNALKQLGKNPETVLPWSLYATPEKARETISSRDSPDMGSLISAHFGFEFPKKAGSGSKSHLNTTMLSGRLDVFDPRSTIIFYRSHLGSVGNLLDMVLKGRDKDKNKIVIQTDLSTTNLLSDQDLQKWLSVTLAGCAYHARRPFAINEKDDPDLCAYILHGFKGLAIFEYSLDVVGRNEENSSAVRDKDERPAWENIRHGAQMLERKWAKGTPLGDGARYILKNYDRLTYYLSDHRLMPSNNFSERMLRLERLIEASALFRQTLEGRFSLDIMRTVIQTAIAAKVPPQDYLIWVMRMPPNVIEKEPGEFTPLAYARNNGLCQN